LAEVLAEGWQVIDVREAKTSGRPAASPGTRHIPVGKPERPRAATVDAERPVVVLLPRSGSRSTLARRWPSAPPATTPTTWSGGITEWVRRGPCRSSPPTATVAEH